MRFRFFTLAFLLVAIPLVLPLAGCKPRPTPADIQRGQSTDKLLVTKPDPRLVGKIGTLYGMTAGDGRVQPNVAFALTWENFADLIAASLAVNHDKIKEMAAAGKVLAVPSGEVRAVFLESRETGGAESVQAVHVKMLSGEYKDQTAWIIAPSFRVPE